MKKAHYALALVVALIFLSCSNDESVSVAELQKLTCDAEQVSQDGDDKFVSGDWRISGGNLQSDEFARSGKYSCRLDKESPHAFGLELSGIKLGDLVVASAWRHKSSSKASLVTSSDYGQYEAKGHAFHKNGDWEYLESRVLCHAEGDDNKVKVYMFFEDTTGGAAWFDDLSIEVQNGVDFDEVSFDDGTSFLEIDMEEKSWNKIQKSRLQAIKNKVIIGEAKEKVPATVSWNDNQADVKLRLKGDWTDHLQGTKWSYRITAPDNAVFSNRSFSIMTPAARIYLREWLLHKFMFQEEVFTTRFEFVPVKVNGKSRGLFAMEDHFTSDLIRLNNRPKGFILKYDENPFWQHRFENNLADNPNLPSFEASQIKAFSLTYDKTLNLDLANKERGRAWLNLFKMNSIPARDLFDMDKAARYFAIIDLFKAWHNLHWHNLRFYFDPQTEQMEFVGFDGMSNVVSNSGPSVALFIERGTYNHNLVKQFMTDKGFLTAYLHYLQKYSDPEYLNDFLASVNSQMKGYADLMVKEFPNFDHDAEFILNRAAYVQEYLARSETEKLLNTNFGEFETAEIPTADYEPVPDISVTAHLQGMQDGNRVVTVATFYPDLIFIYGSSEGDESPETFTRAILPKYKNFNSPPPTMEAHIAPNHNYIHYTVARTKKNYKQRVFSRRYPVMHSGD